MNHNRNDDNQTVAQLWMIQPSGEVTEIPQTEYGPLHYGCPRFDWMKRKGGFREIEHVGVLWQGKGCHMFVDELGHLTTPRPRMNLKATRIYYNNQMLRARKPSLVYKDLASDPKDERAFAFISHPIVGTALLWTGGME